MKITQARTHTPWHLIVDFVGIHSNRWLIMATNEIDIHDH